MGEGSYGHENPPSAQDVIEGRLIQIGLRALELGSNVVIDYGLWGRDERSALRQAAADLGVGGGDVLFLDRRASARGPPQRSAEEPPNRLGCGISPRAAIRPRQCSPDSGS
jgi:hypothetical protein